MEKKLVVGLVAGMFLSGITGLANANLLTNGSFEDNNFNIGNFVTLSAISYSISGWTVTGGSVDWIDNYWVASDGDKSLDLNGSSVGTILSDSFSTTAGTEYSVSFDMSGNFVGGGSVKHLTVAAAGESADFEFDTTNISSTSMGWETMTWSFIATETETQIEFSGWAADGTFCGAALDNVIVLEANSPNPVPEPTTMLLFGTGLVGFVGFRKNKIIS